MSTLVIIVAAGRGSRGRAKACPSNGSDLAGRPVLAHTVAAFAGMPVVLVIHPDDRARAAALAPGMRTGRGRRAARGFGQGGAGGGLRGAA
jgi:2-C-methyl-D-erythritol 4-phosphate cytidylyltransferase/2-C-methyl-D-erythritol 2,4-cyclodiphosphate synthase